MKRFSLSLFIGLLALGALAQRKVIDEVVWVVGDEPILLSDVEETRISQEMGGQVIDNPYCAIPEQIAIQKLFVHQAKLDSVDVSESSVVQEAEGRLSELVSVYGSRENVEVMAHRSYSQLREMYKDMARMQQQVEGVKSNLTKSIKVTPAEVREFYKTLNPDSIPQVAEKVEVQILTFQPKISREEVERVEGRLREFAKRVNSGEKTFSSLATMYSEDGSARMGGDLGRFMGKNELDPAFAAVAFSLSDNKKVSKIVKSDFGYHIIQLIERRGDKIRCRHILLKPQIDEEEVEKCIGRLDSIADEIRAGKFTFEEAAQVLSDDKDTRKNGGVMVCSSVDYDPLTGYPRGVYTSRFELKDLPRDIAYVVDTMKVGDISPAFRMVNEKGQEVTAIVKLRDRHPAHRANPTDDFAILQNMVLKQRADEKIETWLKNKIASTYVRISPDWKGCTYKYDGWTK